MKGRKRFTTIEWKNNSVVMIDQRVLPTEERYLTYKNYKGVARAIKDMVVRGAPAIGVAAAMGVALGAMKIKAGERRGFKREFEAICREMAGTRPTAVNLFWAIERMKRGVASAPRKTVRELKELLVNEALAIHAEDIDINKRMGKNGAPLIKDGSAVLTHCNAGALATAGYGTALGVIRAAVEEGKSITVYADETRPFLQGARLTAWELMKDGIETTLITDNMAGYMMRQGHIDCVVVGADRVAANGDVANKIGTYSVTILAMAHGIPFYVAAPISTIDLAIDRGELIPIEERSIDEVTHIKGCRIAPRRVKVRNPAFDITPHSLVTAIITERGVVKGDYRRNLKKLVDDR
ncbi:MAG: S-methyl-5-thioribose-1-phosphate isomerase [Thermodesulfobacteriota bacterium]